MDPPTDEAEEYYRGRSTQTKDLFDNRETVRVAATQRNVNDIDNRPMPSYERTIDEIKTSAMRSEQASRRRREERSLGEEYAPRRPFNEVPHDISQPKREKIVVTERYVYRPRYVSHVPEATNTTDRQEHIDNITMGTDSRQQFIAETDAAEYYQQDWFRDSRHLPRDVRRRLRPRDLEENLADSSHFARNECSQQRHKSKSNSQLPWKYTDQKCRIIRFDGPTSRSKPTYYFRSPRG